MTVEFGDPRLPSRFWAKVQRSKNGCWHWTGHVDRRTGYGKYALVRNGAQPVHRLVYAVLVAPVVPRGEPGHQQVDHECHNRSRCAGGPTCLHRRCVNPAHLRGALPAVNLARSGNTPATKNAAKTHCVHGHELTAENTYRGANGRRWCKTCQIGRRTEGRRRAAAERGPVVPYRAAWTHCKHGHPLEGENLYVSPTGARGCVTCRRRRSREHYLRRKG